MTKLDGTAKGGILLAIGKKFNLPIIDGISGIITSLEDSSPPQLNIIKKKIKNLNFISICLLFYNNLQNFHQIFFSFHILQAQFDIYLYKI